MTNQEVIKIARSIFNDMSNIWGFWWMNNEEILLYLNKRFPDCKGWSFCEILSIVGRLEWLEDMDFQKFLDRSELNGALEKYKAVVDNHDKV